MNLIGAIVGWMALPMFVFGVTWWANKPPGDDEEGR